MKMFIGSNIKEQRTKAHLTQKELASKIGVSDKLVHSWEVNRTEPKAAHVQKMLDIFGCTEDDLCKQITIDLSYDEYLIIERYRASSPADRNRFNMLLAYVDGFNKKKEDDA